MKRIHYIDFAKGLLILFVIIGHMKVYSHIFGVDNDVYNIHDLNKLWNGFYMQAFFFITGYCSTFKKQWKDYIYNNIKGIIVPLICVSFIIHFCRLILGSYSIHDWEDSFLTISLDYWFLNALFLAKIAYYLIAKLKTNQKIIIALMMYICGFCLWKYKIFPNIWYFKHALMLIPFMTAGEIIRYYKITKKHYIISFCIYLITNLSLLLMGLESTIIAFDIHLDWDNLIQALIMGTFGSIAIIGSCKLINSSRILEYIGKNTLVIFMFHFTPLHFFLVLFKPITEWCGILGWCAVLLSTVLSCLIFVYAINLKQFKWMLGKY